MAKSITLALVNPDGTETIFKLEVDQTLTVVAPLKVTHDRFRIDAQVDVVLRRVR